MTIPVAISPGSDLWRVYHSLAATGSALESDLSRRAHIGSPTRVKQMLVHLRALNMAQRSERVSNLWRIERDETRGKHDVGAAVDEIVLDHIRSHAGCTVEDMMSALGFSDREMRRALKGMKSRGDVAAERDGTYLRYRATKAKVIPLVGMLPGHGDRHDCARENVCLTEFVRREPEAHACHCRPGCAPVLVSRGEMLVKATARRGNNFTAAGY